MWMQEKRTHGNSNWAAFDDFASERTSQLDSVFEQAQKQGPQHMPQPSSGAAQDASSPTAQAREAQDWNAFGSTDTDWGRAEGSSSPQEAEPRPASAAASRGGQDWDAFESTKPEWGSSGGSSQQGTEAQTPPSASWSAFSESDAAFANSTATTGAAAQEQPRSSSSDSSEHHPTDQKTSEHGSGDSTMQSADFGANMYWRTHPLALVDEVDS